MLDYTTLSSKPEIWAKSDKYGNVNCKDLLVQTFTLDNMNFIQPLIVPKEYVARPDLISLAVYHTDKYADVICKANGISNPFELNEGQLIFIPEVESLSECFKKNQVSSEFVSDADEDEIGDDSLNTLKSFIKNVNDIRTSNEMTTDDKNYTIDRQLGLIFY